MYNNDWERFGDEIRRTIQDAVDSRDFSRLNQTVSDTIGPAMDNVSRGLKNGGWYPGAGGQEYCGQRKTPDMETTEMDRRRSRMWACRKEPVLRNAVRSSYI